MATSTNDSRTQPTARDAAWLIRNASGVGATNVVLVLLGVSQSIVLARLLGPAGRGEVYLAVLTAAVIGQLVSMGAGAALQYHLGKGALPLRRAWSTILLQTGLLAVVAGIGLTAWLVVAPRASAPAFSGYVLALLSLLLITELFNELVLPFFVAADIVKWRSLAELTQRLLMLAAAVALVAIADRGVTGAIEAYVIGNFAVQAAVVIALTARIGVERPTRSEVWQVFRFGVQQHVGAVTARALKRFDGYVLWYFMGSAAVGVYSIAVGLAELLLLIPRALNATLISYVSSNDLSTAARATRRVLARGSQILLAGAAIFALIGYLAVPVVYGSDFEGARLPFVVLSLATAILGIYVIAGAFLVGTGRPHITSAVMMASAALNVMLSLWLIPAFGLLGNAIATLIASMFAGVLIVRQVKTLTALQPA